MVIVEVSDDFKNNILNLLDLRDQLENLDKRVKEIKSEKKNILLKYKSYKVISEENENKYKISKLACMLEIIQDKLEKLGDPEFYEESWKEDYFDKLKNSECEFGMLKYKEHCLEEYICMLMKLQMKDLIHRRPSILINNKSYELFRGVRSKGDYFQFDTLAYYFQIEDENYKFDNDLLNDKNLRNLYFKLNNKEKVDFIDEYLYCNIYLYVNIY